MGNVFDVAEHILARFSSASAIKLQKLVYYSQAWHLVSRGERLFLSPIIAYQYGPLCTTLWEEHRGQKTVRPGQFAGLTDGDLKGEQRLIIDSVLDSYGAMSMTALVDRTHAEMPWIVASKTGGEITPESMRQFYSSELKAGRYAPSLPTISTLPPAPFHIDETALDEFDDYSDFLRALTQEK